MFLQGGLVRMRRFCAQIPSLPYSWLTKNTPHLPPPENETCEINRDFGFEVRDPVCGDYSLYHPGYRLVLHSVPARERQTLQSRLW